MGKRSRSSLGSTPITCWSVMHWALTPRGMPCPQGKKTTGTFRPLEHGFKVQNFLFDTTTPGRVLVAVAELASPTSGHFTGETPALPRFFRVCAQCPQARQSVA